ncbi:MAG: exosome complex RNA-binding protein Csl4 [Candidatus Diapherotrites archaeon]|nr:exosome complex RNA-binding protein Csl4 [Candidatus Diapherotrites archaeon]
MKENSGRVVYPGEELAVEEEFEAGENVYSKDGKLFSMVLGKLNIDKEKRRISVRPLKTTRVAKVGDIVFGRVSLVYDNVIFVNLISVESKDNVAFPLAFGIINIRNVARTYIKNLKELFKVGDIVRARIIGIKPYSIELTTAEPSLGVVKAFCSNCRAPLKPFGQFLKCLVCNSTEKRKLAKLCAEVR